MNHKNETIWSKERAKELRTEKLFVRYALLYPETLVSRIHGRDYGNWYED